MSSSGISMRVGPMRQGNTVHGVWPNVMQENVFFGASDDPDVPQFWAYTFRSMGSRSAGASSPGTDSQAPAMSCTVSVMSGSGWRRFTLHPWRPTGRRPFSASPRVPAFVSRPA